MVSYPLKTAMPVSQGKMEKDKSLENWIWDAACSIRGAKDAPKFKDYILPLIFIKRLCDVFDDELDRMAKEVGSRKKAFQLANADHELVRFYLPLVPDDPNQPVWSVIRNLSDKIGEGVTSHMRAIAKVKPDLQGIIDRVNFNATTRSQRDIDGVRLSNLIEAISVKRPGLEDVGADIIGKSYEYLIRKFAECGDQSADEFDCFPAGTGFLDRSSADWDWVQHMPSASMPPAAPPPAVLAMPALTRKKPSASGSSTTTSSRACSTYPKISSTTPPPPASSSSSIGLSPRPDRVRPSSSTLARSSKRAPPQELHPRRKHPTHRRHLHRVEGRGKAQPHRRSHRAEEKRLQHLPQPLHPHQRRRNLPAHRGNRRENEGHRIRYFHCVAEI